MPRFRSRVLPVGVLLLAPATHAAGSARLEPAGASPAAEDGPLGTATNPALAAFDPDAGMALQVLQSLDGRSSAVQATMAGAGTGLGVLVSSRVPGTDVALQSTLSARLPHDWTVGANLWWHLPEGESNNFTAWDLGAGWRPLPWLGLGAVGRDIGSPAPEWGIRGSWHVGAALRPFGDPLVLGVDHAWFEPDDDASMDRELRATLRIHPMRGLALRAYATDDLAFGGGIELLLGGTGIGGWTSDAGGDAPAVALALFSADPSVHLVRGRRRVAEVRVAGDYPYEPRATLFTRPAESYLHLLKRVREAGRDPSVRGLLLHLDDVDLSLAQVEELRDLVADVRASGRPVVAFLDEATDTRAYYLATAADRIAMHPSADLDLKGLSAEMLYFRGTLDLVGVEPQFVKRSDYKSGPEPFMRTGPSDAEREQTETLLDDLHGAVVAAVAEGRKRTPDEARALVEGGPWTAAEAKERGLVDTLLYPDDLEDDLEDVFPEGYRIDDAYLERVDRSGWRAPRSIAVVVIEGPITSGRSKGPGLLGGASVGSETVVKALDQAREDPAVRAVVLRVDSPGGSAFASEDIAHAVDRLVEDGKPVVASMGGVAASGGYYVLSGAGAVYAEPSTITGSIGVYSGRFSLAGLYEKIGVDATIFARGRHAAMDASSRPWDPSDLAVVERLVDATYDRFKARVAEGRNLDPEVVERVARGRVWSGARAVSLGLADAPGGLYDAVDRARQDAGLRPGARYELITYGPDEDGLGQLPSRLLRSAFEAPAIPEALEPLRLWSAWQDEPTLLVMPYVLEVR